MKVRNQKPRIPKPNENKATPPAVIPLPEGTAEAAAEVMANSDIPPGETSDFANADDEHVVVSYDDKKALDAFNLDGSADLVDAASDPTAALRETYHDIPTKSDAEIVAGTIIDAEYTAVDEKEAPESRFANSMYMFVSEGGQKLLEASKAVAKKLGGLYHQVELRLIAEGNNILDHMKKVGNAVWAAYDKWKKAYDEKPLGIHVWFNNKLANIKAANEEAKMKRLAELAELLSEPMLYLTDAVKVLNRKVASLEKELRVREKKGNNVLNRLVNKIEHSVDPTLLAEFTKSMLAGRRTNAVNVYRALTGADLVTAKAAVEAMVAA